MIGPALSLLSQIASTAAVLQSLRLLRDPRELLLTGMERELADARWEARVARQEAEQWANTVIAICILGAFLLIAFAAKAAFNAACVPNGF